MKEMSSEERELRKWAVEQANGDLDEAQKIYEFAAGQQAVQQITVDVKVDTSAVERLLEDLKKTGDQPAPEIVAVPAQALASEAGGAGQSSNYVEFGNGSRIDFTDEPQAMEVDGGGREVRLVRRDPSWVGPTLTFRSKDGELCTLGVRELLRCLDYWTEQVPRVVRERLATDKPFNEKYYYSRQADGTDLVLRVWHDGNTARLGYTGFSGKEVVMTLEDLGQVFAGTGMPSQAEITERLIQELSNKAVERMIPAKTVSREHLVRAYQSLLAENRKGLPADAFAQSIDEVAASNADALLVHLKATE